MSGAPSLELLLAGALAAGLVSLTVMTVHLRQLAERLRSLTRPAHELRGALTALQLGLDAANRRAPGGELRGRADGLRAQLERATLALADLDRRRRGDAEPAPQGGEDASPEAVDLAAVVLPSARAWSHLAPGYGARLDVDWRAGPAPIEGPAASLRQALDNLIANALEHGGGHVLVEGDSCGTKARVTISDGGPGVRGLHTGSGRATWRSARGHGLAIAREAIEAHGGTLVIGRGGNGPALVVELPVSAAAARSSGAGSRAA